MIIKKGIVIGLKTLQYVIFRSKRNFLQMFFRWRDNFGAGWPFKKVLMKFYTLVPLVNTSIIQVHWCFFSIHNCLYFWCLGMNYSPKRWRTLGQPGNSKHGRMWLKCFPLVLGWIPGGVFYHFWKFLLSQGITGPTFMQIALFYKKLADEGSTPLPFQPDRKSPGRFN